MAGQAQQKKNQGKDTKRKDPEKKEEDTNTHTDTQAVMKREEQGSPALPLPAMCGNLRARANLPLRRLPISCIAHLPPRFRMGEYGEDEAEELGMDEWREEKAGTVVLLLLVAVAAV